MHELKVADRFNGRWMEIDEQTNAFDYLERVNLFLSETRDSKWKWIAIALHSALYSFCILAVQGTNPYDSPPAGSGTVARKGDREHLISFLESLKRVQSNNIVDPPVFLTGLQKQRIGLLHKMLRNNFLHFTPKNQSIEISGMPAIVLDAISVIEHIATKTSAIFRSNQEGKSAVERLVKDIKAKAEAMKNGS